MEEWEAKERVELDKSFTLDFMHERLTALVSAGSA